MLALFYHVKRPSGQHIWLTRIHFHYGCTSGLGVVRDSAGSVKLSKPFPRSICVQLYCNRRFDGEGAIQNGLRKVESFTFYLLIHFSFSYILSASTKLYPSLSQKYSESLNKHRMERMHRFMCQTYVHKKPGLFR